MVYSALIGYHTVPIILTCMKMRGFQWCSPDPFPSGEAFFCNVRKRTHPGQNRSESMAYFSLNTNLIY